MHQTFEYHFQDSLRLLLIGTFITGNMIPPVTILNLRDTEEEAGEERERERDKGILK